MCVACVAAFCAHALPAKVPRLKSPGQQRSLTQRLQEATCPALAALQQQLMRTIMPRKLPQTLPPHPPEGTISSSIRTAAQLAAQPAAVSKIMRLLLGLKQHQEQLAQYPPLQQERGMCSSWDGDVLLCGGLLADERVSAEQMVLGEQGSSGSGNVGGRGRLSKAGPCFEAAAGGRVMQPGRNDNIPGTHGSSSCAVPLPPQADVKQQGEAGFAAGLAGGTLTTKAPGMIWGLSEQQVDAGGLSSCCVLAQPVPAAAGVAAPSRPPDFCDLEAWYAGLAALVEQ